MKFGAILCLIILMFTVEGFSMDTKNEFNKVEVVSGLYVPAIQVAVDEFRKHDLDISKYALTVFESEEKWLVSFKASSISKGYRGSPPGSPGYQVELLKKDLSIVQSGFVR